MLILQSDFGNMLAVSSAAFLSSTLRHESDSMGSLFIISDVHDAIDSERIWPGAVENFVVQHGGVRAIYGWLGQPLIARGIALKLEHDVLLFKVVYNYKRPDLSAEASDSLGFLAEIVYGARRRIQLIEEGHPLTCLATVLGAEDNKLGEVGCSRSVIKLLTSARPPV